MRDSVSKRSKQHKPQAGELESSQNFRVRLFTRLLNDAFDHFDRAPYGATKWKAFSEQELACLGRCLSQHLAMSELKMLSIMLAEMLTER